MQCTVRHDCLRWGFFLAKPPINRQQITVRSCEFYLNTTNRSTPKFAPSSARGSQLNHGGSEGTLTYNNAPARGASAAGGNPVAFTASSLNQFILIDVTPLVTGWANGSIALTGCRFT